MSSYYILLGAMLIGLLQAEDENGLYSSCPRGSTKCPNNPTLCVRIKDFCTGLNVCENGFGDENCPGECREDAFRCNNGRCIKRENTCNGIDACGDGSSNQNCADCKKGAFFHTDGRNTFCTLGRNLSSQIDDIGSSETTEAVNLDEPFDLHYKLELPGLPVHTDTDDTKQHNNVNDFQSDDMFQTDNIDPEQLFQSAFKSSNLQLDVKHQTSEISSQDILKLKKLLEEKDEKNSYQNLFTIAAAFLLGFVCSTCYTEYAIKKYLRRYQIIKQVRPKRNRPNPQIPRQILHI